MRRRFQVFVSSTYEDLKEERQKVVQALLALDCLPSSMEIFPAASDDSWTYIKRVIDDCDYYVLIIGGRYGTVDAEGTSYTEREYEYALSRGLEVLCFVHASPGKIAADKSEVSEEGKRRLAEFREKAQKRLLTRSWTDASDLALNVATGISTLIRDKPGTGWVRGDQARSPEELTEVADLRARLASAEAELGLLLASAPAGAADLAQGEDTVELKFGYVYFDAESKRRMRLNAYSAPTWNEVFGAIGAVLAQEAPQEKVEARLSALLTDRVTSSGRAPVGTHLETLVDQKDFETVLVQLMALGLIEESDRRRSVRDTEPYWRLTEYGRRQLLKVRAIASLGGAAVSGEAEV